MAFWRHGDNSRTTRTPEYKIWNQMIQRCTNPKNRNWKNYGGRGIVVCDEWRDYRNFIRDVGRRPSPELTLDRINNDKGYEPGNMRWTTYVVQNLNQRKVKKRMPTNTIWITIGNEVGSMKYWSKRLGISLSTLSRRIHGQSAA